jgi:hypothetical protein
VTTFPTTLSNPESGKRTTATAEEKLEEFIPFVD